MENKWVQVWGQAHSAFSFFYYPSCKKTYRLVIKSALSGKSVRFELSNECAKNDVEIGALSVAKCDKDGNFIGYYENEIDKYDQTYYQLHYAHNFSQKMTLTATAFLTTGKGYYE